MSLRSGAWLAAHELRVRWPRVLLAAAVVAMLSGAAVTMELLARAREEAIAARIDAMGPPLSVVPAGTTAEALGRYELGAARLPPRSADEVASALGSLARRVEPRLLAGVAVQGRRVPLVGLPRAAWPADLTEGAGLIAGAELGRLLPVGSPIPLGATVVQVTRVAQPAGSIDDTALFAPLAAVQRLDGGTAVNELRVYLRAGVAPERARSRLQGAVAGATVVVHDRGAVAGHEAQDSLAAHRAAAYAMLAGVALLALLIAAQLDAAERRVELATLVAIGAPSSGILSALVLRTAVTAAAGAALGATGGVVAAALQDPAVSSAWMRWWPVGCAAVAAGVAVSVLASAGVGLAALLRDPVADLQDA